MTGGSKRESRPGAPLELMRNGRSDAPVLITGGAGFVGSNLADRLLARGLRVIILDNLSRPGVERNLEWLTRKHGESLRVEVADTRDASAVAAAVADARVVYHFAAQVAVTTSLDAPVHDFEINARGTLNVLEAIRARADPPPLFFTSTNKVYGSLDDIPLRRSGARYVPEDPVLRAYGVGEDRALDFHSPYGCSKGAADQYVLDYARTYRIPAVVFRMSRVYGPHQFGNEDQGWIAHFLIRAIRGEPITLYGDGHQVRDVLYVQDLLDAFEAAVEHLPALAGRAYNIGGGPANSVSLLEAVEAIGQLEGRRIQVVFDAWRPGDQREYVSDTRRFQRATGWTPRIGLREGLERVRDWLLAHGEVYAPAAGSMQEVV